jgi:CcmD family protein
MDNLLGYLFAAYSIIFVLIGLYVAFIGRRQARLEREVGRLEASLRDAQRNAGPSEPRSHEL